MRYIIGIDLGTTNSCLCYVDTLDTHGSLQLFRIPQLNAVGHVEALATLPSFSYGAASPSLPWKSKNPCVIGTFAREEGAKTPTKLVESAKSWLCHSAAHRQERLLPFDAVQEKDRISPVEASARYLLHLKESWNYAKAKKDADALFEEQDIVLTVPASFDEVARTLTIQAARLAGIKTLTLLEEPQAAFYSWIAQHEKQWQTLLQKGDQILVCDVGGGTTDFSLIEVQGNGAILSLQRMAVGEHLLLGGDNMDLSIARLVESELLKEGQPELTLSQWLQLRHQARKAKEFLLEASCETETYRFLIQGSGSAVVGKTLSTLLSRCTLKKMLLEGFFPQLDWQQALQLQKSAAVKTLGLPYEVEPAITKHLAHFLARCEQQSAPHYILFNGGTMKPAIFQTAVIDALQKWFPHEKTVILSPFHLDFAVGRGAAYYGMVRRGMGVRIGGGSARGYYLGVDIHDAVGEKTTKALTLLPRGSEEGACYQPEQTFMLRPNTPVSFTLYSSNVRLNDSSGSILTIDPKEMQALPPIQTVLRFGKGSQSDQTIPVRLRIELTAIGTIQLALYAVQTSHQWDLQFQLRTSEGQESSQAARHQDETFDQAYTKEAEELIYKAFKGQEKLGLLVEALENLFARPRKEWSPSLLRNLWEMLQKVIPQRRQTQEAEARWWNLAGFFLRPGFGYPLDDFRIKELWKIILAELKTIRVGDVDIQRWICLRRIAGGLNRGQQTQIAAQLWPQLLDKKNGQIVLKGKSENYAYTEKLRAAASLELIDTSYKLKLGNALLKRVTSEDALAVEQWALGRLGARYLFHGSVANVLACDIIEKWIEKLLHIKKQDDSWSFCILQLARKTGQREIDVSKECIDKILVACCDPASMESALNSLAERSETEQNLIFGEQLPPGLVLHL